jgi:hypothetical protein
MSFEYIQRQYDVPAKRGARVIFKGQPGTITGVRGPHIRVRLDGEAKSDIYHPTWEMVYTGEQAETKRDPLD